MMNRIIEHLFVGTVDDVPLAQQSGMSILGAAKEPFHRQHAKLQGASEEGYVGRAMPCDEPEYLWAEREHALYLNLVDARNAKHISDDMINKALQFIDKEIEDGRNVFIVCNKGESRSPSISLMWMIRNNRFGSKLQIFDVIEDFKENFYPIYNPQNGMREYLNKFLEEYKNGKAQKSF